eukprot:scaffold1376_cov125-Cylindrotheca_fusiformis.AAC.10
MHGGAAVPNSFSLKWLHQFKRVGLADVEVFGDYYGDDDYALECIDTFLDHHSSENLEVADFVQRYVLNPLEYTMKVGIRDITKSEKLTFLRQQKAIFIIKQVIPRIYHHRNFSDAIEVISRALTGFLILIRELCSMHGQDKNDVSKLATFFKVKDFLGSITLQVWTVALYEHGIALVEEETIPYLRQLAMLDIFDKNWCFAGCWEHSLQLLEKRFGDVPRISTDKRLDESSQIIRNARNSLRCQELEAGFPDSVSFYLNGRKQPDHMYEYSPKCSAYMCSEIETPDNTHRLRCYRCHYYHWCSSACRVFTEEMTDCHNNFCAQCPEEKAEQCRAQMRDYLNIFDTAEQDEAKIKCHGCGLLKIHSRSMERCRKCKAVHYCSKNCQLWDWTNGDHRSKCESPL